MEELALDLRRIDVQPLAGTPVMVVSKPIAYPVCHRTYHCKSLVKDAEQVPEQWYAAREGTTLPGPCLLLGTGPGAMDGVIRAPRTHHRSEYSAGTQLGMG